MRKAIIIILFSTSTCSLLNAQTAEDALRFSRIFYSGTARFNGLSGAFGAVGADFSSLATNPAGIGLYKGSESTFTIAPSVAYASSMYNGSNAADNYVNFGIGNIGVIFSTNPYGKNNASPLKNFNIGIGLNRQNNFNNLVVINGVNSENSMMQSYANTLNETQTRPEDVQDSYPFDIGLAYGTNLVFHDSATDKYYCDAAYGGVIQNKTIKTTGSMNELDFSFGANFSEKLFVGMTIGVPTINYYESSIYKETRTKDTIPNFISLTYYYDLHTRGTGFNFKLGIIYKPANWVRMGATVHTPTWYPSMRDQWSSSMDSRFTNPEWNSTQYSPIGDYDYQLMTPFRAMGSLAFIIGQYGILSADYEYVNYSQARFNSTYDSYTDVNDEIKSNYKSWGNIRVGTEWRVENFRIRGGVGYFSNPYTSSSPYNGLTNNSERFQASGGLGYRSKHFFADVTYVWTKMNQDYYLYDASMVNPATISNYTNTVSTTVGFRF
ncbi:MAG: hypothetical protein NTW16_19515 [Bacteroidetes bacterium]|nr:hypothetical protein [Bacteroidota bacterium]